MGRCKQGQAVNAFRDLYDETGEFPPVEDVLARLGAKGDQHEPQGEDIYLHSASGFCYGPGMLGITMSIERINGKRTGRMLRCQTFCGCCKCHRRPEGELKEPEPVDLPSPLDPELEDAFATLTDRKKMP